MAIAGITTGGISLVIVPIILVSILLPALSRARELAKRAVCASNLRIIGQNLHIYANDNGDWFPADLQTLVAEGLTSPEVLICPSSGTAPGAPDFLYVPGLTDAATPNWIVAFDDAANHNGEGSVVLRVDGSATFLREPQFSAELQRVRDEIDASEFAVHPWYRNFDW
ncbi:MAG: type II secretion system protein [Planctomycetes bacterium]|nr:type II secretion system protein [Planctomycetota bacterium]